MAAGSALPAGLVVLALALQGCGQGNTGDVSPAPPAGGPGGFLLFPNPLARADGSLETDSLEYARAYYAAIDPAGTRDSYSKWLAANGFGSGTGTELGAVFGDVRDLGYGRRMTARQNPDGTIAFAVENYLVTAGLGYGDIALSLDAAVLQDRRWLVSINTIEFGPGPAGGASFTRYFSFDAVTGARQLATDLDGLGAKAMPGVCVVCHGGRGDPLTPPAAGGQPLFARVQNSASQHRGDVQAQLLPLEVDALAFSSAPGYTRADQEAALKAMNRMVLCSLPLRAPSALPEDACRRPAIASEYQGTAADFLKAAYGGDGLPSATYSDTYLPPGWAGQAALYRDVVAPACRGCHIVRGIGHQSDIDLDSFAKFRGYAARTRFHAFDRGNMPLARLVYDRFWGSAQVEALAAFLEAEGLGVRDAAGALLRPGRPVAIPGPDRVVPQGPVGLSATGSLFATSFRWSILSGPDGAVPPSNASLANADTPHPTFSASVPGVFVLELVARRGAAESAPAQLRLIVDNLVFPPPASIRFSHIAAAVQTIGCTACHAPGGPPPFFFANVDRNGDGLIDATDEDWFYAEVRGRINFTDVAGSPLLRKPSGNHHGGGLRPGFDAGATPGSAPRANYDLFLNWILNGAPR